MAFGFYHSMVTIPTDMQEAATTYGLTRWQRFRTLELPASAHSLIWSSMMSFGGGWFFVAQSEAITVMNKDIKLPGLGSYMAQAIERGDNNAVRISAHRGRRFRLIVDGKMYGRATAVSKCDMASFTFAVRALESLGARLAGSVELHFTYDEEYDEELGPGWLLQHGLTQPA